MSVTTEKSAGAAAIRPFTIPAAVTVFPNELYQAPQG